jgi:ATP-dependent Lon protease
LINEQKEIKLLARIEVEPNVAKGCINFVIPDAGIKPNEGVIEPFLISRYDELKGGELWGVVTLFYDRPQQKGDKGIIKLIDYKPFNPYIIDLDLYRQQRKQFSLEEWVDVLIQSCEYNPSGFSNLDQKIAFLARLLVFVEPNLNLIELAPKGTGKSYFFGNFSKYGWLISGGKVTRAKLFFDMNRKMPGIVNNHDLVAIDEIQTVSFSDEDELQGALKSYLESGTYNVGNVHQTSQASFILLGNIPLDASMRPRNPRYFEELPRFFQESALLDRFHGFIEGWHLPRFNEDLKIHNYALNIEYFSENLHRFFRSGEYSAIVNELLEVPTNADTRDTKAIKKIATGYLKLLFPDIQKVQDVNTQDFEDFCLTPAKRMRSIIRRQLHLIDEEFKEDIPDIKIK